MPHVARHTDPQPAQLRRCLIVGRIVLVLVSVAMLVLVGRVVQLQHQPPEPLAEAAGSRHSRQPLLARRGSLLDRRGRPLAVSRVGHRLFVDPALIDNHRHFAFHLGHAIGADPASIDQLLARYEGSRYIVVDKLLDDEQAAVADAFDHPAVGLEPVLVRHYPQGVIAGQLVGFVGDEHRGLDGAEFIFNQRLDGEPGRAVYLRDHDRNPLQVAAADYQPPVDGDDVQLSIDVVIQSIAEDALAEVCRKHRADRGEAVVMHAGTGQVLAMANWPRYDPADRGNVPPAARRNRCVTDPYEPGSIFKPFVHAAATDAGVARPSEKIDCTDSGFYISPRGRRLRDAHGHGTLSWDDVLVFSSNIGMAIVGQRLGERRMHAAVRRFGFGSLTGSALPGESVGIVNPLGVWNHYSETSVPMGQEIAVTPLQMVRGFAAFANGGLVPSPSVLHEHAERPIYQRAISQHTADHTRQVLRRVVTEGTGRRARSDKYRIWGKTGTAQVPDRVNGGYIDRAYTASFVCGAPLRRPAIVVLVVVHQPDPETGYYGGLVSAPAARRIVERSLQYLGVPFDADVDQADVSQQVATAD